MTDTPQPTNRQTLDAIIHQTILTYRWAVAASFAFIGVGFLIAMISDQDIETEMGNPEELIGHLLDMHASGFFGAGIGIMILTPIIMIAMAAVSFFRVGDRQYGLITTGVAVILSLSIVVSYVLG